LGTSKHWASAFNNRLTRRRALAATGATAAAAFLAACGGSGDGETGGKSTGLLTQPVDTSKQAVRGGTIKDSRTVDISSFDPHNTQSGGSNAGTVNYYHQTDALFLRVAPGYMKPADWTITGDLAESWEWSPDGLKLTMKRRQFGWAPMPANLNPHLTTGRPITMEDVRWTMNRFFKEGSNRADYLNSLNPAAPVESISYPDDRTLVWNLKFPLPSLTAIMASTFKQSYLMPVEAERYDIRKTPACCGAFYLAEYEPSVRFVLKRNPNWWDKDRVYVDGIDLPIIPEYASGVAQFRTGSLYRFGTGSGGAGNLKKEDLLPLKRDVPQLVMHATDYVAGGGASTSPGWSGPKDKAPFRDERVRQAYSMSLDREAYIDVFQNVSAFEAEGFPMETRWNTSLTADWTGFWLDPRNQKEFGENAKYYQNNLAEAKKLLAAAGYANGLDVEAVYPVQIYGPDHGRSAEVLIGMARETGIRISTHIANDFNEWPPYRDNQGDFPGITYRVYGSASQADPVEQMFAEMVPFEGNLAFSGFDPDGTGSRKGDPVLTDMVTKARLEFDEEKRRALVKDIQRYWGKRQYTQRAPGGSNSLNLVWPTLKNQRVYQGGTFGDRDYWLDPNEAPQKKV
jgi:ABC-type transport system substrate-binding protein